MDRQRDGGGQARRWVGVLGLATAIVLLPACQTIDNGQMSSRPTASAVRDPVLQDIPKPAGFVLDAECSVAISSGRFRLAKCQYEGSLGRTRVKQFYEEYMPSAGFELRRWSLDRGEFTLDFESGSEMCMVRVREKNWQKTIVAVEITPKPQGSTERESRPPTRRPD